MQRDLRGIDLNLLVVLDALAHDPHITKAAQRLHMSQPAVSNALTRLRALFDDDLYVKTRGGMRPTPKALELKQPIREALATIQAQVQPQDRFEPSTAKHTFAIATNEYAESIVFPHFLSYIEKIAPNIRFDFHPEASNTSERIRTNELDLAIDYIKPKSKELICEHILEEELVVLARKNNPYINAHTQDKTAAQDSYKGTQSEKLSGEIYRTAPHVALHPRNDKGSPTEIILGKKRVQRDIKIRVSNLLSLPAIAATTDNLCTVPRRLAQHCATTMPVEIHELPFDTKGIPAYLIYHRDKQNNQAHTWLRTQITQLVGILSAK